MDLRSLIIERAGGVCEYCRLSPSSVAPDFHIDHVIPSFHGGADDETNRAYACSRCNTYKGTNLSGIDPETGKITDLFNPRNDRWDDHFLLEGPAIVGRTAIGRTTIRVLRMNDPIRLRIREIALRLASL